MGGRRGMERWVLKTWAANANIRGFQLKAQSNNIAVDLGWRKGEGRRVILDILPLSIPNLFTTNID